MRSIRKMVLMGLAALMLCAAVASTASALTAYNKTTSAALSVGAGVTGTAGTSTLSGSFFGIPVTITCTSSSVTGTVATNGGATVTGDISNATWSGCSSNRAASCTVSAAGLPWNAAKSGGLVAASTTSVGVAPGTPTSSQYIDVTSCLNGLGSCHVTGATASWNGKSNVAVGTFDNATSILKFTNLPIANAGCTSTSQSWNASYTLKTGADLVGLRTP